MGGRIIHEVKGHLYYIVICCTSKVARLVDECGSAVILKHNVPRYLVIDFSKADKDFTASDEEVLSISMQLMEQNKEAYEVLAK